MDRNRSFGAWVREFAPPSSELSSDFDCLTEFVDWLWSFRLLHRPEPSAFIGVWGGNGVAPLVEMAIVAMGATERRRFCLYVSQNRKLAQERIRNIKRIFQWSDKLAKAHPRLVEPARWRHGQVRNWNQGRLHCDSGFIRGGCQSQAGSAHFECRRCATRFDHLRQYSRDFDERPSGRAAAGGCGCGRGTQYRVRRAWFEGERSLPEALTNGLLPGFFADRRVSRCD